MIFTQTPTAAVINITVASMSYFLLMILSIAIYTSTPVMTQIMRTDSKAPRTSGKLKIQIEHLRSATLPL